MLSDEERKAIKELKGCRDFWKEQLEKPYISEEDIEIAHKEIKHDTILLKLIEKQSKEIEELFAENQSLKYTNGNMIHKDVVKVNYTPNDKIKAKIEELEIEQESNREDFKIAIDNLLFQNIDKIADKISINMSVRGVLQSLLEKE